MSEQDNRALVQRGYDAFGRGDIEALLVLLDDNVEWITPGPSDLPTAGRLFCRSNPSLARRTFDRAALRD